MDKKTIDTIIYTAGAITVASAAVNIMYTATKPIFAAIKRKINKKEEA